MSVSPPSKLRAALIGCGAIADAHAGALAQAGIELVAVCDRDLQKAAELAARTGGAVAFSDVPTLLERARPDVVHVLTPPASHAALAISAAEAGAHALVEKPYALSSDEVDAMVAAATTHGVRILPHHNYLFKPSVRRARSLVAAGEIGDVVHVETFYGLSGEGGSAYAKAGRGHWAHALPGGAFTNFLPHVIYLQAAFLGEIEGVRGAAVSAAPGSGLASELSVLLQGESALGAITISMRAQPYAKYVRIFGTKGILHADLVGEVTTVNRLRRIPRLVGKALFNLETIPQLAIGTALNSAKVATGSMRNMPEVKAFIRDLYTSLEAQSEPPTTEDDGRTVVRVMEEVWERMPKPDAAPQRRASRAREPRTGVERTLSNVGAFTAPVLVTGATGYVGRHVAASIARSGGTVRSFVRDETSASDELRSDTELIVGNLGDPHALGAAMDGVELVVHCAAVTTNNATWRLHEQTNVVGTRNVLEAARRAGVRRLVHISSVVVYGVDRSSPHSVNEASPLPAEIDHWAYYLRSKTEAERIVMNGSTGRPEVVVVRPGIIYGPGAPPSFGLMQLGSRRIIIGRGRNHLPYVYIDNVVDGILLALTEAKARGETYNLVDEHVPDARTVAARAAALSSEPVRFVSLPRAPLTFVAAALERRRERADADVPPRLSRFQIASATRDLRYDATKARDELGWAPATNLDEGLRKSLSG